MIEDRGEQGRVAHRKSRNSVASSIVRGNREGGKDKKDDHARRQENLDAKNQAPLHSDLPNGLLL